MKTCYKCKISKEYNEFYKNYAKKDGHGSICKQCDAIREKLRIRVDHAKHQEAWKKRNPEKFEAHKILQRSVRKKLIEKTECFVCGDEKVEAHHADYDRPLDVIWMCRLHHRETHKMFNLIK